jgi:hypothetical protein
MVYNICCDQAMELYQVCRYTKEGYVTIDGLNITYHKGLPDDTEELDDHVNVELFHINTINGDNEINNKLYITGPDGGFGYNMKCGKCGNIYQLNDK